jgi:hypothetical protein
MTIAITSHKLVAAVVATALRALMSVRETTSAWRTINSPTMVSHDLCTYLGRQVRPGRATRRRALGARQVGVPLLHAACNHGYRALVLQPPRLLQRRGDVLAAAARQEPPGALRCVAFISALHVVAVLGGKNTAAASCAGQVLG